MKWPGLCGYSYVSDRATWRRYGMKFRQSEEHHRSTRRKLKVPGEEQTIDAEAW